MNDRYNIEKHIQLAGYADEALNKIEKTMFNLRQEIRLCLVAIFTRGHVLLEGNPGLGKTALVKALSRSLDLTYGRIQFTPDLMPSDITGTEMPDKTSELQFRRGPIFKTLLLADEINRASPKTQSAMLEAMAERQVTVLGNTYFLPVFFTVLATENPIDHEGTYPLPEAQSDRFMFKVILKPQPVADIQRIVQKDAGAMNEGERIPDELQLRRHLEPVHAQDNESEELAHRITADVDTQQLLLEFYKTIRNVPLYPPGNGQSPDGRDGQELSAAAQHINNMYMASNGQLTGPDRIYSLQRDQMEWVKAHAGRLKYGLGPRSVTALSMAVKAWCVMFPDNPKSPSNVPNAVDMANVAKAVLRHRLKLNDLWEDQNGQEAEKYLTDFIVNTAPQRNGYKQLLEKTMQ